MWEVGRWRPFQVEGSHRNTVSEPEGAIQGIDQNVKVNLALWILAEEMKRLKA